MNRVQYVSQKAVPEADVYMLSDAEQDQLITEIIQSMGREMKERTRDAMPLGELGVLVTGPHRDPLQGIVHVHTLSAWFDMDRMHPDATFRLEYLAQRQQADTGDKPIT